MDSLSLFLSCFKRSVLNNGQLEFIFILFRAVSSKQWTTWVYLLLLFQLVSPKQWTTWVYLHFPKSVIPCFVRKRDVTQSFASLANFIPRLVGIRNVKCYSPVYRNTEHQVSFPGWPDYESLLKFSFLKCHSPCVGGRNVKSVIPSVSGPEMSPIKMSVSTNHQFTNTFQISQYNYQHGSGQSFFPSGTTVFPSGVGSLLFQNKSSLSSHIHNYITKHS